MKSLRLSLILALNVHLIQYSPAVSIWHYFVNRPTRTHLQANDKKYCFDVVVIHLKNNNMEITNDKAVPTNI